MSKIIKSICETIILASLASIAILIGTHLFFDYDYSVMPIGLLFYALAGLLLDATYERINDEWG